MTDAPRRGTPPDGWNARYDRDGYLFGTAPNGFLAEAAPAVLPPGARVLCVADGEGRNSTWLAAQGHAVEAFDPSPVAVEKARRLAAERAVAPALHVADIEGFGWRPRAYDAVAAIFVQFAPPAARRDLVARMHDALRPGGALLLIGYRVEQLAYGTGGPGDPAHLYTEEQVRDELGAFAIDRLRTYDAWLDEGDGHRGMSALLDVVARRPASA